MRVPYSTYPIRASEIRGECAASLARFPVRRWAQCAAAVQQHGDRRAALCGRGAASGYLLRMPHRMRSGRAGAAMRSVAIRSGMGCPFGRCLAFGECVRRVGGGSSYANAARTRSVGHAVPGEHVGDAIAWPRRRSFGDAIGARHAAASPSSSRQGHPSSSSA